MSYGAAYLLTTRWTPEATLNLIGFLEGQSLEDNRLLFSLENHGAKAAERQQRRKLLLQFYAAHHVDWLIDAERRKLVRRSGGGWEPEQSWVQQCGDPVSTRINSYVNERFH